MKKSTKISVLISLLLISIIAIGAVSAAEDTAATDDADLAAVEDVQTVDDAPTTDEINYESNDIAVTDTGDSSDSNAISDAEEISDSAGLQEESGNGSEEAVVSDVARPKNVLKAEIEPDEPLGAPDGTFDDLTELISNARAGSTITLDRNYVYSNGDSTAGVYIDRAITIDGAGFFIDGRNLARPLRIATNGAVTLKNLNLVNGNARDGGNYNNRYYGGAIYCTGGTTLTITNCTMDNNTAGTTTSQYSLGGAIYIASGRLTVTHSEFYNNKAYNGGAIYQPQNPTMVTIKGCAIVNNTATANGAFSYLASGAQNRFDYSENWWGDNYGPGYTVFSQTYNAYLAQFDYYIATEILTSPITIEVNMVLDSGNAPTVELEPRHAIITTDHALIAGNMTENWVPEPFTIDFTTSEDAYINVTIDNQKLVLQVFAGENKKNITELRVEVDNVTLPDQPIAYVYSSVDGGYNLTLGTQVIPVNVTDGVGTYQFTGLNVGQYTVIVSRVDDPVYKTTFNTTDFEVKRYATNLTIDTETPNPTYGTDVTITHELTPTGPSGFITYYVDGSETGTQLGVNEDFVLSGLAAGTHTVVAVYGGDGSYDVSTSNNLTIIVVPATLEFNVTNVTVNYPNKGTVNVSSNADGTYTVSVNNVDYQVTVVNGKGSFEVDQDLEVGQYPIVWDIPEGNYTAASGLGLYNVTAPAPEFDITGTAQISYGQSNTITHTITEGAIGTISYTVNEDDYGTKGLNEDLILEGLDAGHYVVVATYSGGGNYGPTSDTFEFDVLPIDVSVTVTSPEVLYPNTGSVNLTASAPGTYTVKVGDKTYTATVATADVPVEVQVSDVFEVGAYDISVTADLGDNYNPVDTGKIGTYTVVKPATNIVIDVANFTYGDDASATITLKQGETALAGKTINVTIAGTQQTVTTGADGTASVPLSSFNAGKYNIVAIFEGDENYAYAYNVTEFNVNKANATIGVTANAITYGENATINIALDGVNGEKITGVVVVTLQGTNYDVAVKNGVGTLTVSGLNGFEDPGYSITARFAGNDNYNEVANNTETLVVNKADVTITVVPNATTISYGDSISLDYALNVTGDTGIEVVYYLDGEETPADLGILPAGTYTVKAATSGNNNYNGAESDPVTITVEKADVNIYSQNITVTYPGIFSNNFLIFSNVDGVYTITTKDYERDITVSGGQGRVYPNSFTTPGVYDVTASFAGNDNYNAFTDKKIGTYTVKKINVGTLVVNPNATEITYGENISLGYTMYSAAARDYHDPNLITYIVDGVAIEGNIVSLDKLTVGTHTVAVKYSGDPNIEDAESVPKTITVNKATPTIEITSEPVTYPNAADVYVTLTGINNAALPGATVRVTVNGVTYAVETDDEGKAKLTVEGLAAGEYPITAVSVADETYAAANYDGEAKVVVNKADPTVTVSAESDTIKYGETTELSSVVSPADATGDVTYYVDGEAIEGTTVSGLSVGTHTVVAKYVGDKNYNAAESEEYTITVTKGDATVTVSADKEVIEYTDILTLSHTLSPDDATGDVAYYVDGQPVSSVVMGLGIGNHTVIAKYLGDDNYAECESAPLTVTVVKRNATVTVSADKEEITLGETVELSSEITPASGTVTYYVDGEAVEGSTLSNLSVGNHTVVAKFDGDDYYNAAESDPITITVKKITPTVSIVSAEDSFAYGADVKLNITVKDGDKGVTGAVVVSIAGTDYLVNVTDGVGQATVKGLSNDTYTATAKFVESENYTEATAEVPATVIVNATTDTAIIANGSEVTYGEDSTVTISVVDASGTPIEVTSININGTDYPVVNGVATIGKLAAGTYTVPVVFNDSVHKVVSTEAVLKVNPAQATITASAEDYAFDEKGTLAITVVDAEGHFVAGTVNIVIDGVEYKSEEIPGYVGPSLENLATGLHNVEVSFISENYTASPVKTSFNVTKKTPVVTVVAAEDSFAYGEDVKINVTVKDGEKGVTGTVVVTVAGTDYSVNVTDGVGQAIVKGLSNGTYEATAKFAGDINYTEASSETPANVVVNASTDAIITATGSEVTYGEDSTVTVSIVDGAGNPIEASKITINGTEYDLVDGVATIPKLDAGTYTVPVVFDDGVHKLASTMVNLKVNPAQATITASAADYVFDETGTLTITVKDGEGNSISGTVNVTIDGASYKSEAIDGSLDVTLEKLATGLHNVEVAFIGSNYAANPAKTSFTVTKKTPSVSITVDPATIKQTESTTVKVSLLDGDKKLDGTVVVTVAGVDYSVEVSGGEGSVTISNLAPANYTVTAKFAGNENYTEAVADGQKLEVTKVAKVDLNVSAEGNNIVIKLTDEDGKPVDGKVNVTIDGKTQEVTVTNGVAKVPTTSGNHNVTVVYPGDAVHGGTKVVNNIVNVNPKVKKIATYFTVSRMKVPTYNKYLDNLKDYYIYVTLKDANGKPLVGKTIKYASHGKTVTRKTNSKGQIRFYVAHTPSGMCNRAVSFIGDSKYNASFKTIGVKIYRQKVKLVAKKKTFRATKKVKKLTATLKNMKGKKIGGRKIVFIVNGKKYTAKTNKKGVATVKVKLKVKKTYKVTVKFAGDKTFKKATKKTSVKIK